MPARSSPAIRLRRSVLYMPGSNARALQKARELPADALILDLEDAVGPADKTLAREQVIAALASDAYGEREVVVRVNGLETEWGSADLQAVATAGMDAVLLPKIDRTSDVGDSIACLTSAGAPADMPIWLMAETPRAILDIDTLESCASNIAALVMGNADLRKSMRVTSRDALLHSLSRCVLAARANDLDILDGVYIHLDNPDGFDAECRQGRELGFDGKTLIHPHQIAPANRHFNPNPDAVRQARAVLEAWREAPGGVAVLDGRLVERLHADEAQRTLQLHEAAERARLRV